MLRLLSLPFAVLLGVISFGLIGAGATILSQYESGGDRESQVLDAVFGGREDPDEGPAIAGGSLVGFGILGLIAAIALGLAALSSDPEPVVVAGPPGPPAQQQQQVVVVTHGDGRVEVHDRR